MRRFLNILLLISWTNPQVIRGSNDSVVMDEYRLIRNLFSRYDPDVRPVRNSSESVKVKVGMTLNQFLSLDQRDQLLTSSIWFRLFWHDAYLTWDPDKYDGTDVLFIDSKRVWKPDITLYNQVSRADPNPMLTFVVAVSSAGDARWLAPLTIKTSCPLDVTYFPWDYQHCYYEYGSWSFDMGSIDVVSHTEQVDFSNFIVHGEWEVIASPIIRKEAVYSCCPFPFPSVVFHVYLKRKSMYYMINLVLPCVFVTIAGVLSFALPPDAGEKISLSVTILLTTMVFSLVVQETMPVQSTVVPFISQFFLASLVMQAFSATGAVFVLITHYKADHCNYPPVWAKRLAFRFLAPLLGLRQTVRNMNPHLTGTGKLEPQDDDFGRSENDVKKISIKNHKDAPNDEVLEHLRHFRKHVDSKIKDAELQGEWVALAIVMDRLCLVAYIILVGTTSLVFLLQRPPYPEIESPEET